jgi:hypothetical protein
MDNKMENIFIEKDNIQPVTAPSHPALQNKLFNWVSKDPRIIFLYGVFINLYKYVFSELAVWYFFNIRTAIKQENEILFMMSVFNIIYKYLKTPQRSLSLSPLVMSYLILPLANMFVKVIKCFLVFCELDQYINANTYDFIKFYLKKIIEDIFWDKIKPRTKRFLIVKLRDDFNWAGCCGCHKKIISCFGFIENNFVSIGNYFMDSRFVLFLIV